MDKPIPTIKFPSVHEYKILNKQEPLVNLSELGFNCVSKYYERGMAGSLKDCWVRQTVANKLITAETYLPKGLKFRIYDGFRPITIQNILWNFYRSDVASKNPLASDEEIDKLTTFFVSKPSLDIYQPSLHNTGGAVDLTLITDTGYELNMGTTFDDFSTKAWSNHFEVYEKDEEIKRNRRILYNAMIKAGFTNLPSEWWHYDYGTKFWAYFNNTDALYTGIIDDNLPDKLIFKEKAVY